MPLKMVDAYDEDGDVIATYPINLEHINMAITDDDFVNEAKECHQQDGLSLAFVDKWVIREPRPDEL